MGVSRRWALAWVKAEDGDERNDSHANSFFSAPPAQVQKDHNPLPALGRAPTPLLLLATGLLARLRMTRRITASQRRPDRTARPP